MSDIYTRKPKLLTVVICTHNRADLLRLALDSLVTQTADPSTFDVLVIDNNSQDNTPDVVEEFATAYENFHYIFEPETGLSNARNAGWRSVSTDYVGYLDDDAKAPPGWVETALDIIRSQKAEIFGGPYAPYYMSEKPEWYKDEYGSSKPFGDEHYLERDEWLSGGNLFIRCSVFEKIGEFDPALGMSGQKVSTGEESHWIDTYRRQFPDCGLWYTPRLQILHYVPPAKMNVMYHWRRITQAGVDHARMERKSRAGTSSIGALASTLYCLLGFAFLSVFGVAFRSRSKYRFLQNYAHEVLAGWLFGISKNYHLMVRS